MVSFDQLVVLDGVEAVHVERRPIAVVAEEACAEREAAPAVDAVEVRVQPVTWLEERVADLRDDRSAWVGAPGPRCRAFSACSAAITSARSP